MRLPIPPYPHKLDTIFYYLIYSQMILFLLRIKKILLFVSKCQQFCKSQCLLSAKANLNAYHELRLEWAVMESNHPSPKTADLQSAPLPLRYIHPNIKAGRGNRTPVGRLQIYCQAPWRYQHIIKMSFLHLRAYHYPPYRSKYQR